MKTYEIKGVGNTPLCRVYVNGVYACEFTSRYAAKCWIEFQRTSKSVEYDNQLEGDKEDE